MGGGSVILLSLALAVSAIGCGRCLQTTSDELGVNGTDRDALVSNGFTSVEVRFSNSDARIDLVGTLTLPRSAHPHPCVVLITGAGPQDRDETLFGHKPFRVLAEHLASCGIAVLRYDDRGVAESGGSFADSTMEDFASDAEAALAYLRARPEIDSRKVGLVGHSEGGLVAPMVAGQRPGEVAFIVMMAAPGIIGEEVFYLQDAAMGRARGMDEAAIGRSRRRKSEMFSILKRESDIEKAELELGKAMRAMPLTPQEQQDIRAAGLSIDDLIAQEIRKVNTRANRFFLTYDPLPAIENLNIPILVLIGEKDLQVPPGENLPLITKALERNGNPGSTARLLPGLNHLFQRAETGSPDEYAGIKEVIAPTALQTISDWILQQVSAPN